MTRHMFFVFQNSLMSIMCPTKKLNLTNFMYLFVRKKHVLDFCSTAAIGLHYLSNDTKIVLIGSNLSEKLVLMI